MIFPSAWARFALATGICSLAFSTAATAGEPPNQADPCSKAGRNTCGTNGVGRYVNYKFGPRWFGDYRGAVPGEKDPTFCIDLRYWYPGKAYSYKKASATGLKNRDGKRVSATDLQRMNVALWRYGKSNNRDQQGALMMYVHRLMGDGAPGEVNPGAGGRGVLSAYQRISQYAERYDDTIRVSVTTEQKLGVGEKSKLTVRVRTSTGRSVAGISVGLKTKGISGLPKNVVSGNDGTVSLPYTPTGLRVEVNATAEDLPATTPTMYEPTSTSGKSGGASRSGQRLVTAQVVDRAASLTRAAEQAKAVVTTQALPNGINPGGVSTDKITISGPPSDWTSPIEVRLYGPFPSRDAILCTDAPLASYTITAGVGDTVSPPTTLSALGWYGYQITVPSSSAVEGLTTPCVPDEETVNVQVQPTVLTQVSSNLIGPNESVTDSVLVSGLQGQTATVKAELFGPYPTFEAMTCAEVPAWSGTFVASGDGTYVTEPATLTTPGYYTYRESIVETPTIRGVQAPCGELSETTVVAGAPVVSTQVSAATTNPGAQINDNVIVSGLGALRGIVDVKLYGPFAGKDAIRCDAEPAWSGTVTANGDGTYPTESFTVPKVGYYTYVESLQASTGVAATQGICGAEAETTIAKIAPTVTTIASSAAVRPGDTIFDRVKVSGVGDTPVQVKVDLFGPFRSRSAISCGGKPLWTGTLKATNDATYKSPKTKILRAGFYTFRERIVGTTFVQGRAAACGEEAETALGLPLVQTGRTATPLSATVAATSGPKPKVDARKAVGPAPSSISVKSLGIKGPVDSVAINERGEVGVPTNIRRGGWWRDGSAPISKHGTTLIGGHIDSATDGAGIFYNLRKAKKGQRVVVSLKSGKRLSYKITRVQTVGKKNLPSWLFSRTGPRRLALVTCGGPFDASIGHYRDNVIVQAVPV